MLSDWGTWSDCDAVCGTGIMTRTRTIESAPQNGGKHCSSLVQKRGCQGFKCQHHQDRRILRGMFDLLILINCTSLKCFLCFHIKIKSENRVRFNNHLLTYVAYMFR